MVIPLLGFYYTSSDKEREVAKDFVEISTKVLSDKPSDENRPLRKWAIDVLDKYSPVPLPADLKTFLVNNQPIYTAPGGISQNTLQNLESNGMILGIFLSHSNNTPDIAALKAHHIEFAYIRLSQGASFLDPKAEEYITQARNKSLKIGLYHFFVPDVDTDAQFANFQSVLRRVPWDLPPMIDCEELPAHPVPADYAARVARFAQKIEESFRIRPVIYTVAAFANGSLNESVAKYPLFIANFGAAADRGRPTLPKWWTNYFSGTSPRAWPTIRYFVPTTSSRLWGRRQVSLPWRRHRIDLIDRRGLIVSVFGQLSRSIIVLENDPGSD